MPVGRYFALDWTHDDWIVVSYQPDEADFGPGENFWRLRPDASDFAVVPAPAASDCLGRDAFTPTALADGRIAYWHLCRPVGAGRPSLLEATDFDGQVEVLAQLEYNPNRIVWDVAELSGLISAGSGICDGIVRVTPSGIAALPLEVGEGDDRFRVDEYFYDLRPCEQQGRATLPDRSPDGRQVAFLASPESSGGGFGDRLDLPWSIYLVDEPMESSTPREVLAGVHDPRGLRWSPDGGTLALSGEINGESGSWFFDLGDRSLTRFSDIPLAWLAWSPDGQRLVGVQQGLSEPFLSRLVMFQLP